MRAEVHIIGGGLAGCEAAWQVGRAGGHAVLYEMRPVRSTPAHKTAALAELVCSNSLKSEQENSAPWLLKEELRRLGSLLINEIAPRTRVPAGHALTVDRDLFAAEVTRALEQDPAIEIRREEIVTLDPEHIWIIASGPLTSDALAAEIARLTGSERLFFYDSISPIVDAESIDTSIAFRASRYGKSLDGTDDYLNCPFDRARVRGVPGRAAGGRERACAHRRGSRQLFRSLPADRRNRAARTRHAALRSDEADGIDRSAHRPPALRRGAASQENARAGSFNLVGFQNHMRFGEQQRVLRMIPGLQNARVPALRAGASQHLHQRTCAS